MDTINAEKIIKKEQEKYEEERVRIFKTIYSEFKDYIEQDGNFNFDKMIKEGKFDSFKSIEDASQNNVLYSTVIEDFINSNSIVKPVDIRPSVLPSTEELIQRIEEEREKLIEQIGENNISKNIIIGNNVYTSKLLPIREEIEFYINGLQTEIAKATNTELGSEEYKEALIRICTNIVSNENKKYASADEEELVSGKGAK